MSFTKVKALVIVFVLVLFTGLFAVGCKMEPKNSWVNTKSMPGNTFSKHYKSDAKANNSTIVYLGPDKDSPKVDFGPKDVSFNFRDLK